MVHRERILITVMTYPHPSKKYMESVCVAGINESGQWIRLYPIDYRYQPQKNRFRKYQWIEVDLLLGVSEQGEQPPQPPRRREVPRSAVLDDVVEFAKGVEDLVTSQALLAYCSIDRLVCVAGVVLVSQFADWHNSPHVSVQPLLELDQSGIGGDVGPSSQRATVFSSTPTLVWRRRVSR